MALRPVLMPGAFIEPCEPSPGSLSNSYASLDSTQTPRATSPWRVISAQNHPSRTDPRSRKRARLAPRYDSPCRDLHEPFGASSRHGLDSSHLSFPSPSPLVNEKYFLHGGSDTPPVARDSYFDQDDFNDRHYRMGRFAGRQGPGLETPMSVNGRVQQYHDKRGWGSAIVGMVGGVINFCWTKTFRGFYAGEGRGYDLTSPVEQNSWLEVPPKDDVFHAEYQGRQSPIPGQFPEESFIHDYMSYPEAHQAEELLTPVRHDGRQGSEGDWHSMKEDGIIPSEWSPNRANRKVPRTATFSKPKSRASVAGRPKLAACRPSLAVCTGSPGHDPSRTASYASPRGSLRGLGTGSQRENLTSQIRPSSASKASLSTPSPEVAKFEKRIKSQKKKENASFHRMNQKLEDLIRGGTEALGSKVDVEDVSMEDEGYES